MELEVLVVENALHSREAVLAFVPFLVTVHVLETEDADLSGRKGLDEEFDTVRVPCSFELDLRARCVVLAVDLGPRPELVVGQVWPDGPRTLGLRHEAERARLSAARISRGVGSRQVDLVDEQTFTAVDDPVAVGVVSN